MITEAFAKALASEWIAAWNSHDLGRILSHYTDDFEMSSPFIARITGEASGVLRGKEAVGAYWTSSLKRFPDLHFELIEVLTGADSICIHYHSVLGLKAVEWLHLNAEGKVQRAMAHYDRLP